MRTPPTPTNRFDPHDPHHVTLQLLQEVHSMRIQMQVERDKERDLRRQETERHGEQMSELRSMRSEESFNRDQRERELTAARKKAESNLEAQVANVNELKKVLRKCAEATRSQAQQIAAKELERWQ